jgi:hypothetical protein
MEASSLSTSAHPEPLLSDSGQIALRDAALRYLALEPFPPGAPFSRSLWLMFICPLGIHTKAVIPVDDEIGLPDPDDIAGWCDLLADFMTHPLPAETAVIALRRPGTAGISPADEYIFHVMSEAAASRDTAPWVFFVTGPDGVRELPASGL